MITNRDIEKKLRAVKMQLQPPESALRRILANLPEERAARERLSWLRMFWASGGRALVPAGVTIALLMLFAWPRLLHEGGLKVSAPSMIDSPATTPADVQMLSQPAESLPADSMEIKAPLMFKTETLDLAVIQLEAQAATALAASDVPLSAAVIDDRALRPAEARFKELSRRLDKLHYDRESLASYDVDMADIATLLNDARTRLAGADDKQTELRDIARQISRAYAIMVDIAGRTQQP